MLVKSMVACYNKCRKKRPMTASFRNYVLFFNNRSLRQKLGGYFFVSLRYTLSQRSIKESRRSQTYRQVAQAKKNRPNSCRFFVLSRKQTGRRVALCGGFVDIDRAEKMPQSGRLNKSVRPSPFRGKDTAAGLLLPRTFQVQYTMLNQ